jgi:hypothetical protein
LRVGDRGDGDWQGRIAGPGAYSGRDTDRPQGRETHISSWGGAVGLPGRVFSELGWNWCGM